MSRIVAFAWLVVMLATGSGVRGNGVDAPRSNHKAVRSVREVVRAALALLPEQPAYLSLIDVDAQVHLGVREPLRRFEAFTLPRKRGVYVNLESPTLKRAITTREERIYRFDVHVLAAIVWHEMAHLAGCSEAGAQAREETLWGHFIRDQGVDVELGLRQMQIYVSRRTSAPDGAIRCGADVQENER